MAQGNDPGPLWPSFVFLGQSSTAAPDLGMGRGEYLGHCKILYNCWGPGASVFHKHILFILYEFGRENIKTLALLNVINN